MVMPEEAFKGQFMRGKSPCADMAAIKKQVEPPALSALSKGQSCVRG